MHSANHSTVIGSWCHELFIYCSSERVNSSSAESPSSSLELYLYVLPQWPDSLQHVPNAAIQSLCPAWSGFGLFQYDWMLEGVLFWGSLGTFDMFWLLDHFYSCPVSVDPLLQKMMSWWLIGHTNVQCWGLRPIFWQGCWNLAPLNPSYSNPHLTPGTGSGESPGRKRLPDCKKAKLQVKVSPQQGALHHWIIPHL